MLALDFSSPAAEIEAKIQSYVARFLAGREKLVKATRSQDIEVQNRARLLLQAQTSLEVRLPGILKVIEDTKKGVWSVGGLAGVATFTNELINHVKDTEKVTKSISATSASLGGMLTSPMTLAIFGIGAQVAIKLWERSWAKKGR